MNPKPFTKRVRRGVYNGVGIQASFLFVGIFFEEIDKNDLTTLNPRTVGCASQNL